MTPPDPADEPGSAQHPHDALPQALVRGRRLISPIWAIPIVAALVAAFLGWQALARRGPEITITFKSADGLVDGQTKVRYKSVELGTVNRIALAHDLGAVEVGVRMQRAAASYLTDKTHFWVVRPRLTPGNISGLDTLVSGAYIGMDPGAPGGTPQTRFTGLEEPPAIRSDEPGTTFQLHAARIGSLGSGSPVMFHDIKAGEVLGYDLGPGGDSVTLHVFVASPYDAYVHTGTRFWNTSGISVDIGAQGIRLRLESLAAALSGGLAFDNDAAARETPRAARDASFTLYPDEQAAKTAAFHARLQAVSFFEQSVRGLAVGAPVELYGLPVGAVTAITLQYNPLSGQPRAEVHFEIQPARLFPTNPADPALRDPAAMAGKLLDHGLRVQLASANLLTGQQLLSLVFQPDAPPAPLRRLNGAMVLPSLPGGFDGLLSGAGAILAKINALPLQQIADNLNTTLKSASAVLAGPELKQSLTALHQAMDNASAMIADLRHGIAPTADRLPHIAAAVQSALDRTNKLLASADTGYGANSQFRRDMDRLLGQVSEAARSVRLLADYLNQHPDALLRGRAGRAGN